MKGLYLFRGTVSCREGGGALANRNNSLVCVDILFGVGVSLPRVYRIVLIVALSDIVAVIEAFLVLEHQLIDREALLIRSSYRSTRRLC